MIHFALVRNVYYKIYVKNTEFSFEFYYDVMKTGNIIYKQVIMYLMIQHNIISNYNEHQCLEREIIQDFSYARERKYTSLNSILVHT